MADTQQQQSKSAAFGHFVISSLSPIDHQLSRVLTTDVCFSTSHLLKHVAENQGSEQPATATITASDEAASGECPICVMMRQGGCEEQFHVSALQIDLSGEIHMLTCKYVVHCTTVTIFSLDPPRPKHISPTAQLLSPQMINNFCYRFTVKDDVHEHWLVPFNFNGS